MTTHSFYLFQLAFLGLVVARAINAEYTRDDLAIAFPTDGPRLVLIEASRIWRRGIKTHIVVGPTAEAHLHTLRVFGAVHRESFTITPDFPGYPPVLRAALTPLFALDALGADRFKWLLYGDDDTVWVPPAVLRLLNDAGLNAEEPHMLSDFLTECPDSNRPAHCAEASFVEDPRCLPCPEGRAFCPCKLPPECTQPDNWAFQNCTAHKARVLPYGGTGIIYSVGMLRLLAQDPQFFPRLVFKDIYHREPWGGYGFTRFSAAKDKGADCRRLFGTMSRFNDARGPAEFLEGLHAAVKHQPYNVRATALRAELAAARQERVALLQQTAELDTLQLGEADFNGFQSAAPAAAWGTPTAAQVPPKQLVKLNWGAPRAPAGLDALSSSFAPPPPPQQQGGGTGASALGGNDSWRADGQGYGSSAVAAGSGGGSSNGPAASPTPTTSGGGASSAAPSAYASPYSSMALPNGAAAPAATATVVAYPGGGPSTGRSGGSSSGTGEIVAEVLAALLGEPPGSAKLEHMKLDVETVAAVVRQRTADAVTAAVAEAEERLRGGQAERQAKALDKFRGQLADVDKERKSLTGKSGQQARELREAKDALSLSKQLLGTAQAAAEAKAKALAKATADLERMRAEAEEAAARAAAELAEAKAAVEAVQQDAAQQLQAALAAAASDAAAAAQAAAAAHAAELAAARSAAAQGSAAVGSLWAAVQAEFEATRAEAGQLVSHVGGGLAEAGKEVQALQADLAAMRAGFREEMRSMREAAYAAIGGFHAACKTAAKAHAERAAQLAGADEALRRLGPGGVVALAAEAEMLRGQLAEARGATERASAEAAASGAAYRRAAATAEQHKRELQAMAESQKELNDQVAAARAEAAAAQAECATLREAAESIRAQLEEAKENLTNQQAALRAQRRELAVADEAIARAEAAAAEARQEAGRVGQAATAGVAAGRQEAAALAAAMLADLRDRYFQTWRRPSAFDCTT
ncbi:hypothetical protein GPECTOR_3g419 [Gonium pectorale]|uniref:Uncharacterized protein n=1 Tax=Gonium pectorale TaxID=33097 RepID=A0A150GZY0_GONPE|nr:hypothetical protein GPECTOR_3g419 [Gonium pectorale]|eukprot:KXZ55282.1 hypothetical protein GPECTOR_3g419 [Gonium pectorale]